VYSLLPKEFLASLEGVEGYDAAAFEKVHADGKQVTSIRFNPLKLPGGAGGHGVPEGHASGETVGHAFPTGPLGFAGAAKVPWSSQGYYLEERPSFTFDPLFHAGVYYVQEASSMFLEQALRQTTDLSKPLRVLDLCAAPGGKSTLLQSLLSPDSLLVSNEVIKTRVTVLQENMVKWGAANVIITSNDPRDFQRLENYFDVIVVDAPCSGSGLFRREPEAIGHWSEASVQLCHQRQQRILADCWPALRQGGILIYSTCSYSKQEDEDILDWMMEEREAVSCRLSLEKEWNIVETRGSKGGYGYRCYPDRLKGEGFFISVVRKDDGGDFVYPRKQKPAPGRLTRLEEERLRPWVNQDCWFFRHHEQVYALPPALAEDLPYLQSVCYLKKAGVLLGQLAVKEFIPEHDLAVSSLINAAIPAVALTKEQAIQYLRKEEIRIEVEHRGWALVQYEGQNLGWVKILSNRVNNYYPKEWRILKRD